ncbi:MAG: hypothetical protein MPJ50_12370 [Pirellulales bacterium]|nr:hypothetical protein [Pirellulales bacterium]
MPEVGGFRATAFFEKFFLRRSSNVSRESYRARDKTGDNQLPRVRQLKL